MAPVCTSREAHAFASDFFSFRSYESERQPEETDVLPKQVNSNPLEVIGTDYGKFDRLSKEISEAEKKEEEQRKQERWQNNAVAAGCGHDHSKERQLFERPTTEKIEAADRFRLEGNAAFNDQNFGLAAVNYRKALLYFDYTFPETKEEEARYRNVKLCCHLNLAACKLQQKEFEEVHIQCRQALQIDPRNCKAFYRHGLAHLATDNFEEAAKNRDLPSVNGQAFTAALQVNPTNAAVKEAFKSLKRKMETYKKRSVLAYRKMFAAACEGAVSSDAAFQTDLSTQVKPVIAPASVCPEEAHRTTASNSQEGSEGNLPVSVERNNALGYERENVISTDEQGPTLATERVMNAPESEVSTSALDADESRVDEDMQDKSQVRRNFTGKGRVMLAAQQCMLPSDMSERELDPNKDLEIPAQLPRHIKRNVRTWLVIALLCAFSLALVGGVAVAEVKSFAAVTASAAPMLHTFSVATAWTAAGVLLSLLCGLIFF